MLDALEQLLTGSNQIPHGYCLAWSPRLVWSMVMADLVIGLSYYSIPVGLLYFVRKNRELRFNWLLVMFSLFIFACGTTHFIDIANIWRPYYQLDAALKILTAIVSLMTAIALYPLVPRITAFILDRQRAYREVENSNRELEQFAYAVSHDLKSPLRSIGSFAGLLEKRYRDKLDVDGAEYLDYIRQSVTQMNQLIEDLLRLSQVNAGQLETRAVEAEASLAAATELLRNEIAASGASITHEILPTVPGDARLLTSLFQNLISNAIKFQRPGTRPEVHVSARQEGAYWRFSVRDNGIGIAPESRDKLFKIFKRLHAAEVYPGTGIGLVMCRRIVGLHHGLIWFESTPGEGSTFHFTLPQRPPLGLPAPEPVPAAS